VDEPVWELRISHSAEDYSYTLYNPSAGAIGFEESMRVPGGIRADIVNRIAGQTAPPNHPDFDRELTEIGQLVFRRMLPRSIQAIIAKLEGGPLAISTDDSNICWELAYVNASFVALRFAVARRIIVRTIPTGPLRTERPWLEMLLIADPTEDLHDAGREANAIAQMLAKEPLIHVRTLSGRQASTGRVIDELSTRSCDVIHYAGHVRSGPSGAESVLVLSDDQVTASYLSSQLPSDQPPEIVFINACSSAKPDPSAETEDRQAIEGQRIAAMAESFLTAGVRSYVGTLWDVADVAASQVATTFYSELLHGASVGEALRRARGRVARYGASAWGAYLLYGRPNETVQGVRPAIERRQGLRGLREMIRTGTEVQRRQAAIRLGELGYDQATEELVRALHDSSVAVRWRAVEALAKIGSLTALGVLAEYLLDAERDSQLQILVVARGKFTLEHGQQVRDLAETSDDRMIRANAIITLGWIPDESNAATFERCLDDEDDELLQWLAMEAIAHLGSRAIRYLETYQPDSTLLEGKRQRILRELR
jgi:hypothetical protein